MRMLSVLCCWALLAPAVAAQDFFEVLAKLDVGRNPHQIAFSPDGKTAYVAASGSDQVAVVEVGTLRVASRHKVEGVPLGVAVLPGGNELAVTRFRGGGIARFSLPDFQLLGEIETGDGSSLLVPLDQERFLVSTEESDELRVLNGRTFEVEKVFKTGDRPFPPSATPDGRLAFVPNYNEGTVSVFDLQEGTRIRDIAVGEKPSGGAVMRDGQFYGVAVRGEDKMALIRTDDLELAAEFSNGLGEGPFSVVTNPQGDLAFVNNTASHTISVISVWGARPLLTLRAGEIPIAMAAHPGNQTLWVSSEGSHELTVYHMPDGGELINQLDKIAADPSIAGPIMRAQVKKEVEELHQFFEDWGNAKLEDSDEAFERFESVMAEDFQIINPLGRHVERAPLINILRQTHGSAAGGSSEVRIWIENFRGRAIGGGLFLATYEEWQDAGGKPRGRLSTAVFRRKEGTPNGVEWLHVHETWLPEQQ